MLNKITIQGRLVNDPTIDVKELERSGKKVSRFSLCSERDYKPEGAESPEVDFIRCVAWESRAKIMAGYFTKGKPVIVTGRLQTRTYEDNDGNKRFVSEVVVDEIHFSGYTSAEMEEMVEKRAAEKAIEEKPVEKPVASKPKRTAKKAS